MFLILQISVNFEISSSSLKIRRFSPSYQFLLSLFDILNTFIIIFELTLKRKCAKQWKQFKYYRKMHSKRLINLTKFGYKN